MATLQDMNQMLQTLDVAALKWLEEAIKQELKKRIPIKIREVYKRCGKGHCTCKHGELEEYGHGPYLYVTYSENGQQVQKSLGKKYTNTELQKLRDTPYPSRIKHIVPEREHKQGKAYRQVVLTEEEFYIVYGCYPDDDEIGRPRKVWIDNDGLEAAHELYNDAQIRGYSEFSHLGVGTYRGVITLRSLLERGFYLDF